MSNNPPATAEIAPEAKNQLYLAMSAIAAASTPDDIVRALHDHILSAMDRISLVQMEQDVAGKWIGQVISVWDRDEVATNLEFPSDIPPLLDDQPLVVMDTIYLSDVLAPLKAYVVDMLKAASFGIFPLRLHDQALGYLIVAARKTHLQDDREVRMLLSLCWQISLCLENLRLRTAFEEQAERSQWLSETARRVATALDQEALGEELIAQLEKRFPLAHLSITLRQPDQADLQTITWRGDELSAHAMLNNAFVEQVLQSGETGILDGMGGPTDELATEHGGVQKLLLIPMSDAQTQLGTLNIGIAAAEHFGVEDRHLCEMTAAQIAAAMTHMRQFEHMRNSLNETTALYSTSLALNASQNLNEVYSTTLAEVAQLSGADRMTLYLAGPDAREGVDYVEAVAIWKNDKMVTPSNLRYPLNEAPVLAQFPQSRSNLIFNAIQNDMRLDEKLRQYYQEENVNALMVIPLSTGAIWLGALLLEAHKGQQFSNEKCRLSRSLADQAALSLDSQLLLLRTRQAIARERALREITDRIRRASSVEEIIEVTSQELSKTLGIRAEKFADLSMTDSTRLALSRVEREFVENVSAQVSLAVENLKLIESSRKAARTEQAIGKLTVELQRASEVTEVLETAVRTLDNTLDDYDVRIRLVAPTGQRRLGTGALKPDTAEGGDSGKKRHKHTASLRVEQAESPDQIET